MLGGGESKEKLMNCKILLLLTVAIAMLSGCTSRTVLLRNNKGEIRKCEVSTGTTLWTGVIIRDMTIDACDSQYDQAGYKRVDS